MRSAGAAAIAGVCLIAACGGSPGHASQSTSPASAPAASVPAGSPPVPTASPPVPTATPPPLTPPPTTAPPLGAAPAPGAPTPLAPVDPAQAACLTRLAPAELGGAIFQGAPARLYSAAGGVSQNQAGAAGYLSCTYWKAAEPATSVRNVIAYYEVYSTADAAARQFNLNRGGYPTGGGATVTDLSGTGDRAFLVTGSRPLPGVTFQLLQALRGSRILMVSAAGIPLTREALTNLVQTALSRMPVAGSTP